MNLNLNRERKAAARRREAEKQASLREQIEREAAERSLRNAEHAATEAARVAEIEETVVKASDQSARPTLVDTREQLRSHRIR